MLTDLIGTTIALLFAAAGGAMGMTPGSANALRHAMIVDLGELRFPTMTAH